VGGAREGAASYGGSPHRRLPRQEGSMVGADM
jgi:hypothetical protein